ncbi:MAG: M4 family metallopeptidase [Draconibacterium sp.]|nr:M4 family metallopeptidase [Draconibacterium sp.]
MKKYIKFLTFALLCFIVFNSNGQQNDTLKIERNEQGIVNFAQFMPNPERSIQDGTEFLKTFLQAKSDDEFRLTKETDDELGFSHLRFQQYYKGVKVENSEYLIHGRDGIIESINGDFKQVTLPSVIPSINEKEALTNALHYVHAKKYKWEDEAYEKFKKENTNDAAATYYPKGELVIVKDYLTGSKQIKLAWKFTISSLEPYNEQWIYIDAINGGVVGDTPLLLNSNIAGSTETLYSGIVGITWDSYTGGYRLNETRTSTPNHSVNIHTWNCLSQEHLSNRQEFSNNNTNWTTGSWSDISQDQAALDAHWSEEKVLDYWSTVHNRNSLNDQGLAITGYVHFYDANDTIKWPNNAMWDGNNNAMLYGDGDGGTHFYPLVALDVVAHEMGHGITQFTANLTPGYQESGALNEGFSDIWGACVEDWATSNKQTWLMGEEIVNTSFTCLRNLQNPNDSLAEEGQHPDTYHGYYWDFNGEPHNNSTVLSHWFYLLSEGSNGYATNDNDDCFYVSGIGITDAQKIAFRAETHLNSSAAYADARTQTILAASNFFGATSNQVVQTTNAWYGVGVGGQFTDYPVSGPSLVCTSGNFSISNLPTGTTIIWAPSANLTRVSAQGSNPCTFSVNNSGPGWVGAQLVTACDDTFNLQNKTVWVSTPTFSGLIHGDISIPLGSTEHYWVDASEIQLQHLTVYDWDVTSNLQMVSSHYYQQDVYVKGLTLGRGSVYFISSNTCGSNQSSLPVRVSNLLLMLVSPNPASNYLNLSFIPATEGMDKSGFVVIEQELGADRPGEYEVQIWSEKDGQVKSVISDNPKLQISTRDLQVGKYFLHLLIGGKTFKQQIMVER